MKSYTIKCDECGHEFDISSIHETKVDKVKIEDKTFSITYFKCEKCGKIYLIEMLDYRAEKLKKKFLAIKNSVDKKNGKVSQQRFYELQKAKSEAVDYQKYLTDNYANKIPDIVCS